jgi:hypothetical protein
LQLESNYRIGYPPVAWVMAGIAALATERVHLNIHELFIWGQYGDMGKYPPEVEPGRYPMRLRQR